MDPNDQLIEIMAELSGEVREMKDELKGFRSDASSRFANLEKAVDKNSDEVAKLQLSTSELRLSNMALAREIEKVLDLDRRLKIIEKIVLPKAG